MIRTRLKNYAQLNYPIDYELNPKATLGALRRKCQREELNAEKDGKIWFIIGDGSFDKVTQEDNPLIA